jgi:hypothetical protein
MGLIDLLLTHNPNITCIVFMGGDNDHEAVGRIADYIRSKNIKAAMYSGDDIIDKNLISHLDYYKVGSYKHEMGPLNSRGTNQHLYEIVNNELKDITYLFWKGDKIVEITIFWYNKIHSRKGWIWLYPVHETLTYVGVGEVAAKTVRIDKILTVHHQLNKSRASYLPLLELRAAENMDGDIQGKIYLLHQYYFDCLYEKCVVYANKLELKDVEPIYKADIQYYKGLALTQLKRKEDANDCFLLAEQFYPEWRDSYYQSALYYYFSGNYAKALKELLKMLCNTKRLYSWIEIGSAWTYRTYDLISICYFNLGNTYEAYNFSLIAKELCEKENPDENEKNRIESNYKYFREIL